MTVLTKAPPTPASEAASPDPALARRCATALRMLAVDAVERAKSGHPGMPLGMADIAVALWGVNGNGVLSHNPENPGWWNRDRVVVSNGHGSMLLYGVLHLAGYDVTVEDLRSFRQLGSRAPGHPEVGVTPGVETTTGPLGQGLANAVGMALAEKQLAATFNRPGHTVIDHHTYTLLGDGCLMEGVSHEACSLAGVLGLGKLICLWDDNGISIDGDVTGWFADDTPGRFEAYGWQVISGVDGHDPAAVAAALAEARADTVRPTLICCRTTIGFGAPGKAGTHDVHGAPLGADEVAATRAALDWPHAPFEVPEDLRAAFDARAAGRAAEARWQEVFQAYQAAYPTEAAELARRMDGRLPDDWADTARAAIDAAAAQAGSVATRKASRQALEVLAPKVPEMFGGSADLTGSNLTDWPGVTRVHEGHADGRYLSYGVREFGMAAVMNGMALHGGFLPFGGTFLVFSDYSRNAIRMAALMKQRVVHVLTHDSIGLGEDGPTHQPVEHAAALRLIPGLAVWRPCDTTETAAAWVDAVQRTDGPSALLLSRQGLPVQPRSADMVAAIARGGYELAPSTCGPAKAVIIATGSEVTLAVSVQSLLADEGIGLSVVSMPCRERFLAQDRAWKDTVLPPGVPRLAVEAAHSEPWWRIVGDNGDVVGMDSFGESAPADKLFHHFGFTPESVAARVRSLVAGAEGS